MPPSASRLRLLTWISFGLILPMLVPNVLDYEYPPPFNRYFPIGLLAAVCAINAYLIVMHNRIRRQKGREERAEYRRLSG